MTPQPIPFRSVKRPSPVMVGYDAMLDRAVKSLADASLIARTALYERLRTTLVSEIEAAGLSESIDSELRAFDQAVDRLEARTKEPAKPSSELPGPTNAGDATMSDGWVRDLLTRASKDDESAAEATSKVSARIGGERPVPGGGARQWNAAPQHSTPESSEPDFLKMLEDAVSKELVTSRQFAQHAAPGETPAPGETSHGLAPDSSIFADARGRQTMVGAISKEMEEAIAREVALRLVPENALHDPDSNSSDVAGRRKRRRGSLLVGGGISAALGAALVFVAVAPQSFVKDVAPFFSIEAFSRSGQWGKKDTVEASQSLPSDRGVDEPLNSEQSKQVFKQLVQWSLKVDSDRSSQEPRGKPASSDD